MHPLWIISFMVVLRAVSALTQTQRPQTCVYSCLNRFTAMADKIMGSPPGGASGAVSWQNLLHMSSDGQRPRTEQEMKRNFDEMCNFRGMKRCVQQCRDIWLRESVVSGFASIQYVCEDRYQEFITHLPCLAANERRVVERCSRETNQTAAAIAALEKTVFRNDVTRMTATLAALCRNTSQIVDCLTPATREMCGRRPAGILRRLVTLGFRSIEQMYRRMKIEDKLPEECSNLARAYDDDESGSADLGENNKSEDSILFSGPRLSGTAPPAPRRDGNDEASRHDLAHQQTGTASASVGFEKVSLWCLLVSSIVIQLAQPIGKSC